MSNRTSIIINPIEGFSRGFFGRTLVSSQNNIAKNQKMSSMQFDSIDDLNDYFVKKAHQLQTQNGVKTTIKDQVIDFLNIFM